MSLYASEYFTFAELRCKHCEKMEFSDSFLHYLDELRSTWNKPMILNSAYRCPQHPEEVKKEEPGEHTRGAVDVRIFGAEAYSLLKVAQQLGWAGIGLQQKGPFVSRYIHLDRGISRADAPRPTIWTY